jgi:hypothetical protein
VARRRHSPDGGPLDLEELPVADGVLVAVGSILVYARGHLGVSLDEVRHAAGMVTMPVRKQDMGDVDVAFLKESGYAIYPNRQALNFTSAPASFVIRL